MVQEGRGLFAQMSIRENLVLGATFNSQRFGGAYQSTLGDTMSERKDTMFGNITYTIPKTSSTVAPIARQYKYTDEVVPSFYEREQQGLPAPWVARIRASLKALGPRFCATRMLREYLDGPYRS